MQFYHYGNMHVATRITGPRHNYLAITFGGDKSDAVPEIIELPAQGDCEHRPLDPTKILAAVLTGVNEGNGKCRTNYIVRNVQFVKNDTGPEDAYRHMACAIVEETRGYMEAQSQNFQKLMADVEKRTAT